MLYSKTIIHKVSDPLLYLQDNAKLRDEMKAMQDALKLGVSQGSGNKPNPKVKAKSKVAPKHRASKGTTEDDGDASEPQPRNDDDAMDGSDDDSSDDNDEGMSEAAKKQRLRRLCERKGQGKLKVPEKIHEMWRQGGHTRDELCAMLEEANYDKDCINLNLLM